MKNTFSKISAIAMLSMSFAGFSQINVPVASPAATVTQKFGLIEAKVEYSRPSVKGRKIFGDVVPFDKAWRTGANAPTKVTFSDSVTIGGKKIAGGTYSLFSTPSTSSWTITLSKNPNQYPWDFKDTDEATKVTVPTIALASPVESFTIDFVNLTSSSAELMFSWENTAVKFPITTEIDSKVMAEIKRKVDNTDTYWAAAGYIYDNNKDLKTALEYVNKVVEKNSQFWTVHLKAKILQKSGDCAGAVEAAKKSLELATAAKNDDYIKMNNKLIESCPVPAAPAKKK
jgi:hypothetical protein